MATDETAAKAPPVRAIAGVLFVVVLAVYAPALRNGFVVYDDADYVTANPIVQAGLTPAGVAWAFTTGHAANWFPLTWLSHMLDCQLYGLNAAGHHLTNVLLHAATVVLLFVVLVRMTAEVWPSAVVAALFGLHPLRVESVAWVAERKDVLSALFWMVTLLAYERYARQPTMRRYVAVAVAFALGLLAKPMIVTLPFVLLLLDVWPLRRPRSVALVTEKIPLLALAAAASMVTLVVQTRGDAVRSLESVPLGARLANAIVSYVVYLEKTLWPVQLAVFYPFVQPLPAVAVGSAIVLVLITAAVLAMMRRRPAFAVGWLWYLGTLVPVIGIVTIGGAAFADRYTYLPHVGVFIMIVWGLAPAAAAFRRPLLAVVGAAVVACIVLTGVQLQYWRNSETLFQHALAVTSGNFLAHYDLGVVYGEQQRLDDAIAEYREAIRDDPGYAKAHHNLGLALAQRGALDEAMGHYREALRLQPDLAAAHNSLAIALESVGKSDEALDHYREAVRLSPDNAYARLNLATALTGRSRGDEALAHFEAAARLRPDWPEALDALAAAYADHGRRDDALATANRALELARAAGRQDLAAAIAARLDAYRSPSPMDGRRR